MDAKHWTGEDEDHSPSRQPDPDPDPPILCDECGLDAHIFRTSIAGEGQWCSTACRDAWLARRAAAEQQRIA